MAQLNFSIVINKSESQGLPEVNVLQLTGAVNTENVYTALAAIKKVVEGLNDEKKNTDCCNGMCAANPTNCAPVPCYPPMPAPPAADTNKEWDNSVPSAPPVTE